MRRAILLALCAACGGPKLVPMHQDEPTRYPAPLGPVFDVRSKDPAPIVFARHGRGGEDVRYVFRREASPTDRALHAVAIDRGFAYAVGDDGVAVRRSHDGDWQVEPTGTDATLRGLAVATWEAGQYAWYPADPRAVPIYAVGDRGTIVHRDADGAWTAQRSGTDADLHAIAVSATAAFAVGDHGTIVWLHDGTWRTAVSHTDRALRAIAMSTSAIVIVGDGGTVIECTFPDDEAACVPRPSPTSADLAVLSERTVRWDADGIQGFTVQELEAFAADGTRLRRTSWYPIDFAIGPASPFAVRGYHAQHWSFDVCDPEDLAVGTGGAIALVDPYRAAMASLKDAAAPAVQPALAARDDAEPGAFDVQVLPSAPDLDAAVFEELDGFVVGARGTILQLTVEGAHIPVATLL